MEVQMKALKYLIVLFSFMGLMLIGCSDQSQSPISPTDQSLLQKEPIVTAFTGADWPIPPYILQEAVIHEQGQMRILKGLKMKERWLSDSDLMDGEWVNEVNAVQDKNTGEGTVYGKALITPYADVGGGVWEGEYHGKIVKSETPGIWRCTLAGEGHGRGGTIDGMKYKVDVVLEVYGFPAAGWYGTLTGNIYSH